MRTRVTTASLAGSPRSSVATRPLSSRSPVGSSLSTANGALAYAVRRQCWVGGRSQLIGAPPEHPGGLVGCPPNQGGGVDVAVSVTARAGARVGVVGRGPLGPRDRARAWDLLPVRAALSARDRWDQATAAATSGVSAVDVRARGDLARPGTRGQLQDDRAGDRSPPHHGRARGQPKRRTHALPGRTR